MKITITEQTKVRFLPTPNGLQLWKSNAKYLRASETSPGNIDRLDNIINAKAGEPILVPWRDFVAISGKTEGVFSPEIEIINE